MTEKPDPAVAAILEERARKLARPPAPPEAADTIEVLAFALHGEQYGIEAAHVRELFKLGPHSTLPGAQPPIAGIAVYRGALLTLVEMRTVLGLPKRGAERPPIVLATDTRAGLLGLLVDEVRDIRRASRAELRDPGSLGAAVSALAMGINNDGVTVLTLEGIVGLFQGKDLS